MCDAFVSLCYTGIQSVLGSSPNAKPENKICG